MRSKYINTFNTTAEYDAYIESAFPEFPNVGYDKQTGDVKITRTSPNDHILYGTLNDPTQVPRIRIKYGGTTFINCNIDSLNNTFYLDLSDIPSEWRTYNDLTQFLYGDGNITSIKKNAMVNSNVTSLSSMFHNCSSLTYIDLSSFDTSNVTSMVAMFASCTSLTSIDLSSFDISNLTNVSNLFSGCTSLTSIDLSSLDFSSVTNIFNMFNATIVLNDVYITVEGTLMKLTNNLSSQGTNYIPSRATIHYDNGTGNVDYKWQNNAWTLQS